MSYDRVLMQKSMFTQCVFCFFLEHPFISFVCYETYDFVNLLYVTLNSQLRQWICIIFCVVGGKGLALEYIFLINQQLSMKMLNSKLNTKFPFKIKFVPKVF